MNTPTPQDIALASQLCQLADSLPLTQAWKDTAAYEAKATELFGAFKRALTT
jgi:hypothetical protein